MIVTGETLEAENALEFIEPELEIVQERALAQDIRAIAEELFEQHGISPESLPEQESGFHAVRELDLSDYSSTLANISIDEYSDGGLRVEVAFESDDYVNENGHLDPGSMDVFATINRDNRLVSAATTIRGKNHGIHQRDQFHMDSDDPRVYLKKALEALEFELQAYEASIDIGIEPIYCDFEGSRSTPDTGSREIDLGIMLPELALDTY